MAKTTIEQIVKGGGSYQKHFLQIFENFISVGFVLCNTDHNKLFLEGSVVQYTTTESGRMTFKQKSGRGFKGKRAVTTRQGKYSTRLSGCRVVRDLDNFHDLQVVSLRSKRFRLVSEQRKTEERNSRFWPREK